MRMLFANEGFDAVVNLAAQAGVRYSITNPYAYVESNLDGFINVLEGCRYHQVSHLVYASSSSVYGLNADVPFSEKTSIAHPVSLYAASKKSNELMAHAYSQLYGVPATGLRFFTVYGPWGRPDMSPFLFTDAILHDRPIHPDKAVSLIRMARSQFIPIHLLFPYARLLQATILQGRIIISIDIIQAHNLVSPLQ